MKQVILMFVFMAVLFSPNVFSQPAIPRESNGATISQTVGDTMISIVYHRPNSKGRKIWGCETKDIIPKGGVSYPCLVPYGQVWRTGANENTTIEVSRDVSINGQSLPKGKYGLHTIPGKTAWIIILNKVNNEWGSFNYDEKKDQIRVLATPQKMKTSRETMMISFESVTPRATTAVIEWERIRVPFTVDIGDVFGRTLSSFRDAIASRKVDDFRPLNQAANYVYTFRLRDNYDEALGWLNTSIGIREAFGSLNTKARILFEQGKKADAIATAEKAIQIGKAANPPANTTDLERLLADWKAKK
jgi:hypothetical protein